MRALVPLLILLSLAAACGGGSTRSIPTPSPTRLPAATATPALATQAVIPFTPVEEILTPPPNIDTSSWLTYQDTAHGFELRYPPDAQVIENTYLATPGGGRGLGTKINLPIAQGTTLIEKYFFVEVTGLPADACAPAGIAPTPEPAARVHLQLLHGNGADFWITPGGVEVASGGAWSETFYTTSKGANCVTLDAVFYGANRSLYSTPPPPSDDQKESETFTAILSTFRWTQP